MENTIKLVPFSLEGFRLALRLECVTNVIQAVEITRLPNAPDVILGVINVHGSVLPVADLRKHFGIRTKPLGLYDHIIVVKTKKRTVGIIADRTSAVVECAEADVTPATELTPGLNLVEGIVRHKDGLIIIQDMDKLLSLEEETLLETAIEKSGKG
jgi:purine-binding chemotaxis protein CheW